MTSAIILGNCSLRAAKVFIFADGTVQLVRPKCSFWSDIFIETAKANNLDAFKYFELLLTVLPSMTFLTNTDILEELLPWNESVQKICKAI